MCGAGSRDFFPNVCEDPISHRCYCQERASFFFFKEIRIVSNNLPPKVFLRSNADPTVKQERLIQKYLLF